MLTFIANFPLPIVESADCVRPAACRRQRYARIRILSFLLRSSESSQLRSAARRAGVRVTPRRHDGHNRLFLLDQIPQAIAAGVGCKSITKKAQSASNSALSLQSAESADFTTRRSHRLAKFAGFSGNSGVKTSACNRSKLPIDRRKHGDGLNRKLSESSWSVAATASRPTLQSC